MVAFDNINHNLIITGSILYYTEMLLISGIIHPFSSKTEIQFLNDSVQ